MKNQTRKNQIRIAGLIFCLMILSSIFAIGTSVSACPAVKTWFAPDNATIIAGESILFHIESEDSVGNDTGYMEYDTVFEIEAGAGGSWDFNTYTSENPGTWEITGVTCFKSCETSERFELHCSTTLTVLPAEETPEPAQPEIEEPPLVNSNDIEIISPEQDETQPMLVPDDGPDTGENGNSDLMVWLTGALASGIPLVSLTVFAINHRRKVHHADK